VAIVAYRDMLLVGYKMLCDLRVKSNIPDVATVEYTTSSALNVRLGRYSVG
jgi:hypothetical protein